jgi:hypothetical protein
MKQASPTRDPEPGNTRIAEDRAAKILERAAALDAKRNTEIELHQLREAAEDAGISPEAFDEALRESATELAAPSAGKRGKAGSTAGGPPIAVTDLTHYAAILTDVLGDEGRISVTDGIEWRDDEGLSVTINPGSNRVTAAVSAEGRLRTKMMGVVLPALLPLSFFFLIGVAEEEEAFIGFIGVILAVLASMGGTWFTHRREQKALRKKAERIRRQLQRLLTPAE